MDAKTITPAGDWFAFSVPVSKANEMFNTQFSVYTHTGSGQQSVRVLEYSLPTDLQGHVRAVHPTTSYVQLVSS